MIITEEKLKIKKYNRHPSSNITHQFADFIYQRGFNDETGIKYFINFIHYPMIMLNSAATKESWTAEMTVNEPHMKFCMYDLDNRSIGHVEKKMKRFWEAMGKHYYEKF